MSYKSVQTGDDWNRRPGTCDQTGNSAPKYPWSASRVGRFARIAALCCAYKLGYDDDRMAKLHEFPPADDIARLFNRLVPWFADHYNELRESQAEEKGYVGPLQPFGPGDVENRVRYCFALPGRRGHDPRARGYGISVEHPSSTYQRREGGRGEVFARCSEEIMRRLDLGKEVTLAEAWSWGA
jgi:hypothetical protein